MRLKRFNIGPPNVPRMCVPCHKCFGARKPKIGSAFRFCTFSYDSLSMGASGQRNSCFFFARGRLPGGDPQLADFPAGAR